MKKMLIEIVNSNRHLVMFFFLEDKTSLYSEPSILELQEFCEAWFISSSTICTRIVVNPLCVG